MESESELNLLSLIIENLSNPNAQKGSNPFKLVTLNVDEFDPEKFFDDLKCKIGIVFHLNEHKFVCFKQGVRVLGC